MIVRNHITARIAALYLVIISSTARVTQGQQHPQAVSPLIAEAQHQAEQFWGKWLTKCGDSYFDGPPGSLREFKEIKFGIVAAPLSRADELNGIQWKGNSMYAARAMREQEKGVWGAWMDGPQDGPTMKSAGEKGFGVLHLEKKDGQWVLARKLTDSSRPESCAAITGLK
jgi:hypothetical protein